MIDTKKNISVIGLGYIGLPTAALLASRGYSVSGTDLNEDTVSSINKGEIETVEPDLKAYVRSVITEGKLKAYTTIKPSDVYMICVPTPIRKDNKIPSPDIDKIVSAANSIAVHIKKGDLVILESTSPVGTTEMIKKIFDGKGVDTSKIFIAYCPERVIPGNIMKELIENPRVIGGVNKQSTYQASEFYQTFVTGEILETEAKTAEMCKLVENGFRDVNIAFANELSLLCDKNGVNVWDLIKLANHHPRVDILQPGTGVGGHCVAVDPWFLVSEDASNAKLIKSSREINDSKPKWVAKKIIERANAKGTKKIACLGISFKPDIDDLRDSPAKKVIDLLLEKGFEVSCVEPNIQENKNYNLIDLKTALDESPLIALLVKHKEFLTNETLKELKSKDTLDFCGVLQ